MMKMITQAFEGMLPHWVRAALGVLGISMDESVHIVMDISEEE